LKVTGHQLDAVSGAHSPSGEDSFLAVSATGGYYAQQGDDDKPPACLYDKALPSEAFQPLNHNNRYHYYR
jgi:hypothetical protein